MRTRAAEWRPGWYELDQPIEEGLSAEFAFFSPEQAEEPNGVLLFYNTLWNRAKAVSARGVIAKISHPVLGALISVDTRGLDYTFVLKDGRRLVVNAEEKPGTISELIGGNWATSDEQVPDWTLAVEFADLGPLLPAPRRLNR